MLSGMLCTFAALFAAVASAYNTCGHDGAAAAIPPLTGQGNGAILQQVHVLIRHGPQRPLIHGANVRGSVPFSRHLPCCCNTFRVGLHARAGALTSAAGAGDRTGIHNKPCRHLPSAPAGVFPEPPLTGMLSG